MNTNETIDTKANRFSTACINSCKKIMGQISAVKAALLQEFSDQVETHNHLLQLALNEAQAIAEETAYPQLLFPVLAEEKVRAVNQWSARQEAMRRRESSRFAARL